MYTELRKTFTRATVAIPKNRHRLLYGNRGQGIHEILEDSGCSIILPTGSIDQCMITGPAEKIGAGMAKTLSTANSYQIAIMDISRAHQNAPLGAGTHARALLRLLQKTQALKALEAATICQMFFPVAPKSDGPVTFDIVAKTQEDLTKGRQSFKELIEGYTPNKVEQMHIDPLWHQAIIGRDEKGLKQIYEKNGVRVLIGEQARYGDEVFLVYDKKTAVPATEEEISQHLTDVKSILDAQSKGLGDIIEETLTVDSK